jgi:toxin ParE1/3/4
MRIRKTDLAQRDLENIYRFGFERFGLAQADLYAESLLDVLELLALNPMMGRVHLEYLKPVRIHSHKAHLIVYDVTDDAIVVVRVLSHYQNVSENL